MAFVKAKYTINPSTAKAGIRYIQHRPGRDGTRTTRPLFSTEGGVGRWHGYEMIEKAEEGSIFFRFIISPDPKGEDGEKDLHLREVTERTMLMLEERVKKPVHWIAAAHDDHAPHRHVHIIAVVQGRLGTQDFQALRKTATEACLEQRKARDRASEQNAHSQREELQLERQRTI